MSVDGGGGIVASNVYCSEKMVQYEAAIIIPWLFYSHFVFNGILIIVHLYTLDFRLGEPTAFCVCVHFP